MDKFLLKVCNKDTKRKLLRNSRSIFIVNSEQVSVQPTRNDNCTPFLNRGMVLVWQ